MQALASLKPAGKMWSRLVGERVDAVRAPADVWVEHGAAIVDAHPGVGVVITKLKVDAAKQIAKEPWLTRVAALDLEGAPLAVRTVLAAAGPLTRLTLRTGGAGIDKTLAFDAVRTVEALELRGVEGALSLARAIAENELAGRLVHLRVGGENPAVCGSIPLLEVEGLEVLAGRSLPKLASLVLANLALQEEDPQGRAAVALARLDAPALRELHVDAPCEGLSGAGGSVDAAPRLTGTAVRIQSYSCRRPSTSPTRSCSASTRARRRSVSVAIASSWTPWRRRSEPATHGRRSSCRC